MNIDIKELIQELWSRFVWRLYKTTDHHTEMMMHEMFMHSLLDDMKAPRKSKGGSTYGSYGRLQAWCEKNGIRNSLFKPEEISE